MRSMDPVIPGPMVLSKTRLFSVAALPAALLEDHFEHP